MKAKLLTIFALASATLANAVTLDLPTTEDYLDERLAKHNTALQALNTGKQEASAALDAYSGINPSAFIRSYLAVASKTDALTALNVEDGATADQTALEIIDLVDAHYGSTAWRTQIPNTDSQTLGLSGVVLSIAGGNSVDLSPLQDGTGTDNQELSISGNTLSIQRGNSINLSSLQDGTGTDDQTAAEVSIADAGGYLSGNDVEAALQELGLSLSQTITNVTANTAKRSYPSADEAKLGNIEANATADQTASEIIALIDAQLTGSAWRTQDGTGTDSQTLNLTGTTLSITGGNNVDLVSLRDGTGTDSQTLSLVGSELSISGGNSVTLSGFGGSSSASGVSLADTGENYTATTVEGAFAEAATKFQLASTAATDTELTSALSSKQDANAHLTDLSDGELSGSKVGSGIDAANITTGSIPSARIGSSAVTQHQGSLSITKSQVSDFPTDQLLTLTGTDLSISRGNTVSLASLGGGGGIDTTAIDTFAELNAIVADADLATEDYADAVIDRIQSMDIIYKVNLTADDSYSGPTHEGHVASVSLAQWAVVYRNFATGKLAAADADGTYGEAITRPIGMTVEAYGTDESTEIITTGYIRNDAWSWTDGPLYLSTTAGQLTQTPPTGANNTVLELGYAVSSDIIWVDFAGATRFRHE